MAVDVDTDLVVASGEKPLTTNEMKNHALVVQRVLNEVMVEGIHFGTIPGTPKPTLYQAGSEKICMSFRLAPKYSVEDLSDPTENLFRYRSTCSLYTIRDGLFVGSAVGECSTAEEKYQWRKAVCPQEWEEAEPSNRRKKWYKDTADPVQQVRTNAADLANTALKIANKRAFISATRGAVGASDLLEVDLEDSEAIAALARDGEKGESAPVKAKPKMKAAPAPEFKYGPEKGKRVDDPAVTVAHLKMYLEGKTRELANPDRDKKWDAGSKLLIAAIEAELLKREPKQEPSKEQKQEPGKKQAKEATSKPLQAVGRIVADGEWTDMLVYMTEEALSEYTAVLAESGAGTAGAVLPNQRMDFYNRVRELVEKR